MKAIELLKAPSKAEAELLEQIDPKRMPQHVACLLYTSGSQQAPSPRTDTVREAREGSSLESDVGPASSSRATEARAGQR